MYEAKVNNNGEISSKRVQLPNDSLEWLIEAMKQQGMTEASLGSFGSFTEDQLRSEISSDEAENAALVQQQNVDGIEGL